MQNTCNWDSYALTLRQEMSSYLSENPVDLIKTRTMITPVPKQKSKKPTSVHHNLVEYAVYLLLKKMLSEKYHCSSRSVEF
ncbi:hypothetical protein [Sphingobacterium faecium]|uniref:hypothetical protein n=1 Tax=Sphingobacterium faecium TaxID=34087 RepID=UPI0024788BC9|nr:hypothetical protein [Sphingobacterium faecium]WGQ15048.1 hypothetical protein QG727_01265 [Sphingobacterium faecium]